MAKLLQKASKKRQLDAELLTGYTGITVMILTLTLTLTQNLTLYNNPYYNPKISNIILNPTPFPTVRNSPDTNEP